MTTRDEQYDDFVSLLGHCEHRVRRFVRSLMVGAEGIDDVMQDVSLECWRKFESFSYAAESADPGDSRHEAFIRWACVIARFKVLSRVRDASRERLVFSDELVELLAEDSSSWAAKESPRQAALTQCLSKLSQDDRRLLLSVHATGDSVAGIAKQMGVEARRLYSRVNALRSAMLKCVQSQLASQ
ncbi:sigma-70 family RNA polymerase sigma factor [Rubripirellula reticaptiva]|uniref:RNA polymerase sigma factor n=1 Tax=Rubripirellula reticaptiva TaxID=2528013 RepID=A0A5C6FDA1_9BACT|nr:sigma-70 family RNA polymerase sigma factor [Rubripirellula reticaptiva]TWU57639.1 RNA polymerase sigma factor [Rubripirellula reticaptiva]